jgi:hypothetical protein
MLLFMCAIMGSLMGCGNYLNSDYLFHMILFPHSCRILLWVKPNFPILRHRPRIAVLPQMWHQLAFRIDVQELFANSAIATIVKSFILFLATSSIHCPDGHSLF